MKSFFLGVIGILLCYQVAAELPDAFISDKYLYTYQNDSHTVTRYPISAWNKTSHGPRKFEGIEDFCEWCGCCATRGDSSDDVFKAKVETLGVVSFENIDGVDTLFNVFSVDKPSTTSIIGETKLVLDDGESVKSTFTGDHSINKSDLNLIEGALELINKSEEKEDDNTWKNHISFGSPKDFDKIETGKLDESFE